MNSFYSVDLRYLIRRGLNLCNIISDYTEAQIYFMMLVDGLFDKPENTETPFTITGNKSEKEIDEILRLWKGE